MPKPAHRDPVVLVDAERRRTTTVDAADDREHLEAKRVLLARPAPAHADDLALLLGRVRAPPAGGRGRRALRPASQATRPSTSSSTSSSTAPTRTGRPRRGALLLLGPYLVTVHRDDCPPFGDLRSERRPEAQPPAQGRPRSSTASSTRSPTASSPAQRSSTTASTSSRTACCRSRTTHSCRRSSAQAAAGRLAQGHHARARPLRAARHRRRRDPRHDAGHGALLPRRLRPPHPHQRPGRQLSRPADRRDGRLPLDRLQPAERGHEAADDRGDDLHAAHVASPGSSA